MATIERPFGCSLRYDSIEEDDPETADDSIITPDDDDEERLSLTSSQAAAPRNDLGERVIKGRSHRRSMDPDSFGRRMCWTLTALISMWGVLWLALAFVVGVLLPPDANTEIRFDEFLTEDTYGDIVEATLPSVQSWYRSLSREDQEHLLPTNRTQTIVAAAKDNSNSNSSRVADFFQEMLDVVNTTTPAYVKLVLTSLNLQENLLTQLALQDLLESPQPLDRWVEDVVQCHGENSPVQELCRTYQSTTTLNHPDYSTPQTQHVLRYFANVFAVYQTLTRQASQDTPLLTELSNHMIDIMEHREQAYAKSVEDPVIRQFATVKYQGIAQSLHELNLALATNNVDPSVVEKSMQINILEAAKVDMDLGHDNNAKVALALASALQYGPEVDHHVATWKHGADWVEAYIAWNMAFIVGSLGLNRLIKLMIPAVACTPNHDDDGQEFITPRVISLALGLMHEFPIQEPLHSSDYWNIPQEELDIIQHFYISNRENVTWNIQQRYDLAEEMGHSVMYHAKLPSPSTDTVERMLYNLCAEKCYDATWAFSGVTVRTAVVDSDDLFTGYVALILWLTVLLAGMGLELLVWLWLSTSRKGWSSTLEKKWWLAQFMFPLFATTCLGLAAHQDYLALPFLVFGLWKFGMPESVSYMYMALYDPASQECRMVLGTNLLNSVGTLLHHSSATIPIATMLSGRVVVDRHILDPILILVMQHWFVLTKYINLYVYSIIELFLELMFELAVFSELQYLHTRHWSLVFAALGMLLAHWMYLVAAALELRIDWTKKKNRVDNNKGAAAEGKLSLRAKHANKHQHEEEALEAAPVRAAVLHAGCLNS